MSARDLPRADSDVAATVVGRGATEGRPTRREPQRFGTIVIVGGGCYGSYYLRQLTRARDAGAIEYARIIVVDRDPRCRVARAAADARAGAAAARTAPAPAPAGPGGPPRLEGATDWVVEPHHLAAVHVEIAPWEEFLPAYFDAACADPTRVAGDAVVPSPLMPHLAPGWLAARARRRWPERAVSTPALEAEPNTPWQRAAADGGTHYVSFATWMCPINCIEPRTCPETRGPRSWSMPEAARAYVADARARGQALVGPLLFHCEHRAFGVGMFDTRSAIDADAALATAVAAALPDAPVRALVASVSNCHGAWSVVEVGPRA